MRELTSPPTPSPTREGPLSERSGGWRAASSLSPDVVLQNSAGTLWQRRAGGAPVPAIHGRGMVWVGVM
jgi:hypothetical protein